LFNRCFNKIQYCVNAVTGAMLVALCLMTFIQVIMRFVFRHALSWSEELTRYLFVWIVFLGVNLGIRDNIEIRLDIIDAIVKGKAMKVIRILRYILTVVVICGALFASFYLVKVGRLAKSPTMQIPMYLVYIVFPVGFTLDVVEVIRKIVQEIKSWNDPEDTGVLPSESGEII